MFNCHFQSNIFRTSIRLSVTYRSPLTTSLKIKKAQLHGVCSKEANRLPKQYCVSLCFFCFVCSSPLFPSCICHPLHLSSPHLSHWKPVCLDPSLSLSALHGHFLDFHILLFSWRNRSKEGISPLSICLPLSPLLQKHSGRGRVSIFPQPCYLCVCLYLCLILHSNSSLFLHRENWVCRLFGYWTTSWSKSSIFNITMHLYFSLQIAKETTAPSVIFLWSQLRSAHRILRCCGDSGTSAVIVYIA